MEPSFRHAISSLIAAACEWEKELASTAHLRPPHPRGTLPRLRRFIEGLGPYQSLLLLCIPATVVEPLKLVAVAVAGDGHWITGTVMIVAAYAASLLIVERLFRVVKPKLLTLPWFAWLWNWFVAVRSKTWGLFRSA